MDILVLLKSVPEVAEAELEIADGRLDTDDLVFGINEWDNFALEEAIRVKQSAGGTVTVITVGDEEDESEDMLRRALAMGADAAIHLNDQAFAGISPAAVVELVATVARERPFDLIFTGVHSSDSQNAQTGVLLAQRLDLPFATLATRIDFGDGKVTVYRELESDTTECVELPLPALVTIQSGINQPRYVSVMGIRKVRGVEIDERDLETLQVELPTPLVVSRGLRLPQRQKQAQILEGSPVAIAAELAALVAHKGGVS